MSVAVARRWAPPPLIASRALRWGLVIGALAYLAVAAGTLDVNWRRVWDGLERGRAFVAAFVRPDFLSRRDEIVDGILESLVMTAVATAAGIVVSVPVGLGAARNLAPRPVYLACRAIVAGTRTLQDIIVAILFVKMFGFGPLAGTATLAFTTIGFLGKLLAEDIEDTDRGPIEAVRATGAGWLQVLAYAVQPQVLPRLIGLSLYRLDINFRESAVIGIVGAGGIGATLTTAFGRYEYDTAAAILLTIIAIVMAAEYTSGLVRRWVQ